MIGNWKLEDSKYLMQSQWYALRQDQLRLPNGRQVTYNVVEHPGYVLIVPLLADGRVVMERIYRYTLDRVCLECPAGGLDGEAPEVAARRELAEETGYRAGSFEKIGRFAASSGISNIEFEIYLATELQIGETKREDTEQIEIDLIPLAELRRMALDGRIENGPSALAILLASERVRI